MKVKRESEVAQSCLTLSDPTDCSPPGSPVPGIFQARVLEWGALAFSELTAKTQQMCCPYMFVTINALPYVLGKKKQAYGKKKKKIQVKGEYNMRRLKTTKSHSLLTEYHD